MKILKKSFLSLLLNLPGIYHFFLLYYYFSYQITCILTSKENLIWCRNSFYFDSITIGQSDIDYTLLLPLSSNIQSIKKKYERVKSFIPINGEFNFYILTEINQFSTCYQNCEILRDPELITFLKRDSFILTPAKKISFILRQILSDGENLVCKNTRKNKNKWRYLINILNEKSTDVKDLSDIVFLMNNIAGDNFFSKDILRSFIFAINKNQESINNILFDPHFILYFPHCWYLGYSQKGHSTLLSGHISQATPQLQEVCLEQIRLEIFGLISQHHILEDSWFLVEVHLPLLLELLETPHYSEELRPLSFDLAREIRLLRDIHLKKQ